MPSEVNMTPNCVGSFVIKLESTDLSLVNEGDFYPGKSSEVNLRAN